MPMLNGTDWFHETALTTSLLASVLTLLMSLMILQPAFGFGSRSHGLPDLSFKLAVDSTDISVKRGKTMPTFHEQRSLSERLYEAQGINTQQLLGHSSEKMTAQYHNDRGLDWVKVKV
ncbi:hypothetical protein ACHQI3_12235 [Raoultella planticola]|uniref:hypothetical protein n=1 Tax=Raoultella planticola TaxID=575 RepID=UPI003982C3DD